MLLIITCAADDFPGVLTLMTLNDLKIYQTVFSNLMK